MSEDNSTGPHVQGKPDRPENSPLFWHQTGRWAKKIRGRMVYFGRGAHDEALTLYLDQRDALYRGLTPVDTREGLSVFSLCGQFLTFKKGMKNDGELSEHTFQAYAAICKLLVKVFGKSRLVADLGPDDFARLRKRMSKTWGAVRLKAEIVRARVPFNWAMKNGMLEKAVVFGEGFRVPSMRTIRRQRREQGAKMFEAEEIRAMLDKVNSPMRAMILLGINCGFGNSDCGTLPLSALDLERGWINYPRPKTEVGRRCPLWPETIAALKDWIAKRPDPTKEEHRERVFITGAGNPWNDPRDRAISKEMRKLLDRVKINGHRNFYALRHTLQTIGDEARDFLAVRTIMGHVGADIADEYREKVSDERLVAVVEHVRGWLFLQGSAKESQEVRKQAGVTTKRVKHLKLFTA